MNQKLVLALAYHLMAVGSLLAAQGPAGTGACAHVFGPVDGGRPVGFTCQDVGGTALLVWNASQQTGTINITGGITALNFAPGSLTIDGTVSSTGMLGFVGNGITINGTVSGQSVLIAGMASTTGEVTSTLLGPSGRILATSSAPVTIGPSGKVTATTGNVNLAGSSIRNDGSVTASLGTASLTVGTQLDVGWMDTIFLGGVKTTAAGGTPILNYGTISAQNVTLEAHRGGSRGALIQTIRNFGTVRAKDTITFVTGLPGVAGTPTYIPGTMGIANVGDLYAASVTISPFYVAPVNGKSDRTFDLKLEADRDELQKLINGRVFLNTSVDPGGSGTTPPPVSSSFSTPATVLIPQLSASLTHMNANSKPLPQGVAASTKTALVRGSSSKTTASTKPRVKAKPVLLRGAFFDSKISAKLK
jgi:hypothetical protein